LTIQYEQGRPRNFTGEVVALFNPDQFTLTQQMTWEATKSATPGRGYRLHFTGDSYTPATLQLALFFDTYEGDRSLPSPDTAPAQLSVTTYTEAVANLIRIDKDLHRPPICKLLWGKLHLFRGVLISLSQQFTLFQANGTPVRATLTCTFQQFRSTEVAFKELDLHSVDVPKTRLVRRGDTLSSIAAEEYHDPSLWRAIATANGLHNPRALTPGQILRIPKLLS
jgi:nucleoid-associated protein YgaU